MNTPNPLIPQGANAEQTGRRPFNVRIIVISIIAIHLVAFGGLLMQGCKREQAKKDTTTGDTTNASLSLPAPSSNAYFTNDTQLPSNTVTTVTDDKSSIAPIATPAPAEPAPAAPAAAVVSTTPGDTKEYSVVKNDSFYTIAKAHGVTIHAISQANPTVDPKKLKVGQKIQIPAAATVAASTPTPAPSSRHGSTAPAASGASSETPAVYVVKAGDTLTRIANQHHTQVKALRSANGLRTDRLVAGQKLKIPAPKNSSGDHGNGSPVNSGTSGAAGTDGGSSPLGAPSSSTVTTASTNQ